MEQATSLTSDSRRARHHPGPERSPRADPSGPPRHLDPPRRPRGRRRVPRGGRLAVRGETLDDEWRATLVHELTHALQDQHFDIGARDPEPSGAAGALRALIEADPEAVSEAWVATLPATKREALLNAEEATGEEADLGGVPEVFARLATYPYLFGPVFFEHVVEERGQRARDEMFRDPPTTDEHILRPETYLTNQRATAVPPPPVQEGEESIEDGEDDFGALSLLLFLAQRVDFVTAWEAVQGWAGDASVAFERAGVTCVRVEVMFDEPSDADRFGSAFRQWAGDTGATGSVDGARALRVVRSRPGHPATAGRPPVGNRRQPSHRAVHGVARRPGRCRAGGRADQGRRGAAGPLRSTNRLTPAGRPGGVLGRGGREHADRPWHELWPVAFSSWTTRPSR